ncbi:MAG: two-CW domain-containing protein [Candidatus Thorarchaeota archaeon]
MTKKNCWEFMECGRQPGGQKAEELGVCPAAIEESTTGTNSGSNGGRVCWAVVGTLCRGEVQGEFASKMGNCIKCDFYHTVESEESSFVLYPETMARINCWEFKQCGRERDGVNADELGVCPAAVEISTNGINNGDNGGRTCWALAGTLCGGTVQGEFASKIANCVTCEFYNKVLNEETDFVMYPT